VLHAGAHLGDPAVLADARGAVVVLTAAGHDAIARANPVHSAGVRRWFIDALTRTQIDAMIEISTAVADNLAPAHPELSR